MLDTKQIYNVNLRLLGPNLIESPTLSSDQSAPITIDDNEFAPAAKKAKTSSGTVKRPAGSLNGFIVPGVNVKESEQADLMLFWYVAYSI